MTETQGRQCGVNPPPKKKKVQCDTQGACLFTLHDNVCQTLTEFIYLFIFLFILVPGRKEIDKNKYLMKVL